MTKVVVLLAAYNGRHWLEEQIRTLLSQEAVELTVFVSVDRSSDGTEGLIDDFSSLDKRVKVLPHGQRFGGAGGNFFRLIREVNFAQFDYVAFADQDDIWLSNKLSRACNQLKSSKADAYSSNVVAFWENGRQKLINKAQAQTGWDFLFEAAGPGCTYVLTSRLAKDIQQVITSHPREMLCVALHDWFIYAYARSQGYRWIIDGQPSMRYRQHSENQVGANAGFKAFAYRVKKVIGGWGINQSAAIAHVLGLLKNEPVCTWLSGTRIGYLRLARHFWQCRRRLRDKFLFLGACLLLVLLGTKIDQK